jgi:4-aminobutyrate aminotransferase-like enzyme
MAVNLTSYPNWRPAEILMPGIRHAAQPNCYRCAFHQKYPECEVACAQDIEEIILRTTSGRIAALIAEPIFGVSGLITPPQEYFKIAVDIVHKYGGLFIADEVQTAYGRIGSHFYAFEPHEVIPDIVVLGKPIGNGYPLGAVVTTPAIAASFDNGMEFFSTFGGSTVACAVGLAVLDVVEEEGLQAHALGVGTRLLDGLRQVAARHPIVGDVRGAGLFQGMELVRDHETLEPAPREAAFAVNRLREEGILVGTDGPFHNVIKIRPPMPFDASDADRLVSTLDSVLSELG